MASQPMVVFISRTCKEFQRLRDLKLNGTFLVSLSIKNRASPDCSQYVIFTCYASYKI